MKYARLTALAVLFLLFAAAGAFAGADVSGTWKASFDTQIGQQNYTYTFAVKDGVLTGTAESEIGGKTELKNGKVDGDKISFVENFKYQDMDIQIVYTGTVTSADEIKFTRQVGEFATEELVARRAK